MLSTVQDGYREVRGRMAVLGKAFSRPAWLTRPVLIAAPICLLLGPLLPLIHQALFLSIAVSLRALAQSYIAKNALMGMGLDPVYASVLNRTLGNIDARGLAVADPAGNLLHSLAPQFFASPDQVLPGAWATALVSDGVSLLSSTIATLGAEVILIIAGLALLWAGLRKGKAQLRASYMVLAVFGISLQARGVGGLLSFRFSLEDMEIMGLSHVFTKLVPVDSGSYDQMVSDPLATTVAGLLSFVPVVAIYGGVLGIVLLRNRAPWRQCPRVLPLSLPRLCRPVRLDSVRLGLMAPLVTSLLVGGVLSQGLFPAEANYSYSLEAEVLAPQALDEPFVEPALVAEPPSGNVKQALPAGPSKVEIAGGNNSYTYYVNGVPQKLKGVGYNPMYSHLSESDRASQYDRDFGQMKATGVNTILGWEREQFDDLTLRKAQEYGIGVILPYYLPREGDYGSPAYQQEVEQDVKEWVRHYRGYPALRMWGIGNEVVHGMGRDPNTPQARAFGQFYVKLADMVHSMDPDHPVTYRDAEDLYLPPIREALNKDGIRRPWFVYGMNFFTTRICEALPNWPKREMDVPVMVSEFAPSGLQPADRPKGYINMLRCITKQHPTVLGGFVYVWFTSGPEAIDRVMGLVDAEGRPVDRSLHYLGKAFRHNGETLDNILGTQ